MQRARILFVALLLLAQFAPAEDFWLKKPYQQWSKTEATHLLQDSPWAQQVTFAAGNVDVSQRNDSTNLQSLRSTLHSYWQRQTLDLLKPTTLLNVAGQQLPLMDYVAGEDESIQLFFPRPQGLAPTAVLRVQFEAPGVTGSNQKVL